MSIFVGLISSCQFFSNIYMYPPLEGKKLSRVVLDDELLLYGHRDVVPCRQKPDLARHRRPCPLPSRKERPCGPRIPGHSDYRTRPLCRIAISSPLFHEIGRDVHCLAVHRDVGMGDHLPGFFPRNRKAYAVDHVVESSFEKDKQVRAGDAFRLLGHDEKPLELVFR